MTSKSVGSIVSLQRGNSYKSKLLGPDGPKLLGLGSIAKDGGFKGDKLKSYSGPTDPRHLLFPGDIYVSLKDVTQSGDLLGAIAQVPENIEIGRLTQDTVKLKFEDSDFSRDYLYWALRSPQYRHYCRSRALGTTNLSLSREDFLSFEIPELTETRANIVSSLQALDDKIEVNRKTAATLEEMARALYRSWFVDFDPVHAKAAGRAPAHMDAQTAALFPDRFDADGLPEGWVESKLGEMITRLKVGKLFSQKTVSENGKVPVLDQGKQGVIGFHNEEPNILAGPESRVSTFANHTCVQRLLQEPFSTIQNVIPFVGKGLPTEFCHYSSLGKQGFEEYRGHWPSFVEAKCNVPVVDLAKAFASEVSPWLDLAFKVSNENQTLATLRETLLPRLMSGELRVGEAKKQVEAVA